MPRYFQEIEVPADTAQRDAVEAVFEVDERLIVDCMAYIDPGSKNQVNVELVAGEQRLFPTDDSDPFRVPAVTDTAPIGHLLSSTPSTVRWRAWSPGSLNDHIVLAYFDTRDQDTTLETVRVDDSGAFTPTDVSDRFSDLADTETDTD